MIETVVSKRIPRKHTGGTIRRLTLNEARLTLRDLAQVNESPRAWAETGGWLRVIGDISSVPYEDSILGQVNTQSHGVLEFLGQCTPEFYVEQENFFFFF